MHGLLERFEEGPLQVSRKLQDAGVQLEVTELQLKAAFAKHPLAITGTVCMTLEVLQRKPASAELAVMIAATACPEVPVRALPQPTADGNGKLAALKELQELGLVRLSGDVDMVFIHPLTQDALVQLLASDERFQTRGHATFV